MPDSRLKSWLQETVATQLQLGHAWFSEQQRKQCEGIKPDPDGHWVGLYEDNGSCVDIVDNIHPDQQSTVQIIRVEPVIVSDGETYIEATLTAKCERDLRKNYNGKCIAVDGLHSFVSVRKYTLRQTSYGPPRHHLRLILHAVDWQGSQEIGTAILSGLKPVQSSEEIGKLMQQFTRTRTEADRRKFCLDEDRETDSMSQSMDISDGDSVMDATLNTQMPFGTQVAPSLGKQPTGSALAISGTHAMEPILAGNTRTKELPPTRAIGAQSLLNLINKNLPQRVTHQGTQQEGFTGTQSMGVQHSKVNSKSAGKTADHQASSPRKPIRAETGANESPVRRLKEGNATSPEKNSAQNPVLAVPTDTVTGAQDDLDVHDPPDSVEPHKSGSDWMTGWIFNHHTTKVTSEQQSLLSKPETWQKPQPGHRFPEANIPIQTLMELSRLNNESPAPEEEEEEEEEVEQSTDDESLPQVPPEPEEDLNLDVPSSSMSWSQSPSPEPPQQSTRLNLPPDSSIENDAMDFTPNLSNLRQAHTITTFPSQKPIEATSSADKEGAAPPSSPPLDQEAEDSDEEMELEVSVPQGLGDDHPGPPTLQNSEPIYAATYSQAEITVQVKETPYAKGKNGQSAPLASIPSSLHNQTSSGEPKDSSSASIIYGTYSGQRPYAQKEGPLKDGIDKTPPVSSPQSANPLPGGGNKRPIFQVGTQTHERKRVKFLSTDGDDVTLLEASSNPTPILKPSLYQPEISLTMTPLLSDVEVIDDVEGRSAQPEPSPMSAQVPPQEPLSSNEHPALLPDHASNSHVQIVQPASVEAVTPSVTIKKRKLDNASPKKSNRHSKRREIKVVGFGGPSEVTRDPIAAFQKNREHSIERILQDRTPQAKKALLTKPTQDLHIRSPPAGAGRRLLNVSVQTVQAHDAISVNNDVEMDRSPNQFAPESPIPAHSPPLFSSPILGSKRTSKIHTPKPSAPNITTLVAEDRAVNQVYEEDPSEMDVEQQRETRPIDSPSDLDTFMLDVHAISSTRPESPHVKQTVLRQSATIPEESSITYLKKPIMSSPYREEAASERMVVIRPKSGSIASDSDNSTTSEAPLEDSVRKDVRSRHTGSPLGKEKSHNSPRFNKMQEADGKLDAATPLHFGGFLHGRPLGHKSPKVEVHRHSDLSLITNALSLGSVKSNETTLENVPDSTHTRIQRSLTIFQKFQTAYPEYTGTAKQFTGLCKEMYKLDQEDKMVPKWQWDDYLIRRRIDYKDYLDQCENEGEQSEPYHRFYKDNIRDTLYTKGVLKNRAVLATALSELQIQPPITTAAAATPVPERAPQRGRQSLPSSGMLTQPKAHQARQSLPPSQLPAVSPAPKARQQARKSHPFSNIPAQSLAPAKSRRTLPSAFQKIPSTLGDPIESSTLRSTPISKPRGRTTRPIDALPVRRQSDGPFQLSRTSSITRTSRQSSLAPHLPQQASHLARTSRTSSVSSARSESRVSQLLASTPRAGRKSGDDEYGDWYKAHVRIAGFTGDSRVDDRVASWPENVMIRRTVQVKRDKEVDVLSWKDNV